MAGDVGADGGVHGLSVHPWSLQGITDHPMLHHGWERGEEESQLGACKRSTFDKGDRNVAS